MFGPLPPVEDNDTDNIVHAPNGGEQRIDGNFVDGDDPQRKTIYEFIGCMWHGCDKCYMPDMLNPVNETSMENLLGGTICNIECFKKLGYNVEVKWESSCMGSIRADYLASMMDIFNEVKMAALNPE